MLADTFPCKTENKSKMLFFKEGRIFSRAAGDEENDSILGMVGLDYSDFILLLVGLDYSDFILLLVGLDHIDFIL